MNNDEYNDIIEHHDDFEYNYSVVYFEDDDSMEDDDSTVYDTAHLTSSVDDDDMKLLNQLVLSQYSKDHIEYLFKRLMQSELVNFVSLYHLSCIYGDIHIIDRIVYQYVNCLMPFRDCSKIVHGIHLLCKYGHLDALRWALTPPKIGGRNYNFHAHLYYDGYCQYFNTACMAEQTEVVTWILDNVHAQDSHTSIGLFYEEYFQSGFISVCETGNLHMAKFMYERGKTCMKPIHTIISFDKVIYNGHLHVLQWIYKLKFEETFSVTHQLRWFYLAAKTSHINVIQWMYDTFPIAKDGKVNMWIAFDHACSNGKYDMAKWINDKKYLMNDRKIIHIFEKVCSNGHVNFAQWIYDCTEDKALLSIPTAFQVACNHNHISVAQWLYECTEDKMSLSTHTTFKLACDNNYVSLAQWLHSVDEDNCRKMFLPSLESACVRGNFKTLHLLRNVMGPQATGTIMLNSACVGKNTDVVKYVLKNFPREEIRDCCIDIFIRRDRVSSVWDFIDELLVKYLKDDLYVDPHINNELHKQIRHALIQSLPNLPASRVVSQLMSKYKIYEFSLFDEKKQLSDIEFPTCCICLEREVQLQTECKHNFCGTCITIVYKKTKICPCCRQPLGSMYLIE